LIEDFLCFRDLFLLRDFLECLPCLWCRPWPEDKLTELEVELSNESDNELDEPEVELSESLSELDESPDGSSCFFNFSKAWPKELPGLT
jgi:hypothetical protein